MKFKINNLIWEIKESSQKEMKAMQNKRKATNEEKLDSIDTRYYGITLCDECKIYLDKDLPIERKKTTLLHELTHCYITSYVTHLNEQYYEENVCDIFANSYFITKTIFEKYFKEE